MDNKKFRYYLHKTSLESPEFIEDLFNNGLKSWYGTSLHSTLHPVDDETLEKFGVEKVIKDYLGKNNEQYKAVVLVKIPIEYLARTIHRTGKIDPPIPVWRDNGDGTMSFTPNLIQGIYCSSIDKGITNPNFSPVYDPSGLKYSKEQIDAMWYANATNSSKWIAFAQTREKATYELLKRSDISSRGWTELIQHYSGKFGIAPKQHQTYSVPQNIRNSLNVKQKNTTIII